MRRNIRLRKAYLYRKSLEAKERKLNEKKKKLKEAINDKKTIPTELLGSEHYLQEHMKFDTEIDLENRENNNLLDEDNEYSLKNYKIPKICITSSRYPSSKLRQFLKEINLIFGINSVIINRGNHRIDQLISACQNNEYTDLIIVNETRGRPDTLIISHLPYGPTAFFSLNNCILRHDMKNKVPTSEQLPHVILDNFETTLGQRVGNILKFLFPKPKDETKRIVTFSNNSNIISFRHHIYEEIKENNDETNQKRGDIILKEIGPRFDMNLYQIRLGTLDQDEAENEWVLRPYMNSAKRRKVL